MKKYCLYIGFSLVSILYGLILVEKYGVKWSNRILEFKIIWNNDFEFKYKY